MNEVVSSDSRVFPSTETLAQAVSEWICELALASDRDFAICLSGGSTPRRLYEHLAGPAIALRFPWGRTHWFWGDERFVAHDHPDSNYRMVHDALLSRVPIASSNIHAIPTEGLSPKEAACAYEATLRSFYGALDMAPEHPLFDVTLLGIGEDGHTASLFPAQSILDERGRWAVDVKGPKSDPRITLTYTALDSSRDVAFLATGERKREAVMRAQSGDHAIPAARVRPVGKLHWFMDDKADPGGGTDL
jgi:6-phosphogluconolactonase